MAKSSNSVAAAKSKPKSKPNKPWKDFPLFPHATGRWVKKIRGKLHYFGPWDNAQAALDKYLDQKDDLHAGRTPRVSTDGLTVMDLCNRFLTSKNHQVDSGEITPRTFADYKTVTDRIVRVFGLKRLVDDLRADDFEQLRADISKTRGLVALGNEIQRVRVVFNYAYQSGLIEKPIRYGPTFKRPAKRVLRKIRNGNGPRMFEAHEIRRMLDSASLQLRAMILLGINRGFGNSDCGSLPATSLDLDSRWVNFPRPKTGIERRCPLWPETVEALEAVLAERPEPKDAADVELVFITKYGQRWIKESSANPISAECRKLVQDLRIHRSGVGFYALRHGFETIGGEARDQVAVDHIMGHADQSMAAVYRERISDERLVAVTDYVWAWLFEEKETE